MRQQEWFVGCVGFLTSTTFAEALTTLWPAENRGAQTGTIMWLWDAMFTN